MSPAAPAAPAVDGAEGADGADGTADTSGSRRGTAGRVLVLARVALAPTIPCYAVCVVLAGVVAALASGTTPGGGGGLDQAVAVGVPLWLAAHLVPLRIGGAPLGVLPLAPAAGVAALIAVVARGAVHRLVGPTPREAPSTGGAGSVVATATASHAVMGVLAAALLAPDTVIDASPGQAGVVSGLLAGIAALAGVAGPAGLLAEVRRRVPAWTLRGIGAGAFAATALLTAGAVLLLALLLADAPAVAAMVERIAPQAGSGAGLTLLSALYLPNAVVAATSWLLGPGLSVGLAAASPTGAVVAPLPPIPLLAAMPSGPPPSWAGLSFAVPLAIGSLVGWRLAPTTQDPVARRNALAAVGTAAGVTAVLLGLAAWLAGGRLGAGPFDPVSVPCGLVLAVTLGWVLVPGLVIALLAVPTSPARPARRRSVAPARSRGTDDAGSHALGGSDGASPAPGGEAGDEAVVTTASGDGDAPDGARPD